MITIRKEQMESIANAQMKDFEKRVKEHLQDSFPHRFENMSEQEIRQIVQSGMQEARDNDITAEQEIVMCIDLTIVHGEGFAADISGGVPQQEGDVLDDGK